SARSLRSVTAPLTAAVVCAVVFTAVIQPEAKQRASEASTPGGHEHPGVPGGGGRGRGRGPQGPPPPARQGAPVDLTGNWVSMVTEDWQWRMRTPPKGDYASVPMTPQARQLADTWDPSKDGMCEAYGVGGIMSMPGRRRISWQDDNTLKIETDAGQQTRLLHFTPPGGQPEKASAIAAQPKTLQGYSAAEWVRSGGAFDASLERGAGAAPPRWGSLKVVT